MLTMNLFIVFIMLFVPSLCEDPPEPDRGSPEEFLKEVNEYRAKFAKEHRIPNMYELTMLTEKRLEARRSDRYFYSKSYRNMTAKISKRVNKSKEKLDANQIKYGERSRGYLELLNPLQTFIECSLSKKSQKLGVQIQCRLGSSDYLNFWYANPGEAGSQCSPRFKGENGLCVPVDPSKHTYWETKEELLEDVNYMRRKYAKEFGIPNMHQLSWNESLVEVLKTLNLNESWTGLASYEYFSSSDSSWDGFGKNWRLTDLASFSAAVVGIDDTVQRKLALKNTFSIRKTEKKRIRGKEEITDAEEMIHPLQTSIGCMEKKRLKLKKMIILTTCLLGNVGQWPSDWELNVNSTKIPGSECMNGYVNDNGLCVLAPPTTTPEPTTRAPEAQTTPKTTPKEADTVPATPMNPEASVEKKEKEGASVEEDAELEPGQEALESSFTTRSYSYGPCILVLICLLF